MKNFMSLFAFMSALVLPNFVYADTLPVRQKRLAIVHLSETQHGQELMANYKGEGDYAALFDSVTFEDLDTKFLFTHNTNGLFDFNVALNKNYLSSHFSYLSWSLSQALFELNIDIFALAYEVNSVPAITELSIWNMAMATLAWDELVEKSDFCNDARYGEDPKRYSSCPSRFSDVWNNHRARFISAVQRRNEKLGVTTTDLQTVIDDSNGTRKEMFIELQKAYLQFAKKYDL